jgi:hypothetical protein
VINKKQVPVPDNTQRSKETDINVPAGIEPAIPRLRPRGHRFRPSSHMGIETVKCKAEKENKKHWLCALQHLRYCPYVQAVKPAPLSNNRVKFEVFVTVIVSLPCLRIHFCTLQCLTCVSIVIPSLYPSILYTLQTPIHLGHYQKNYSRTLPRK